MFMTINGESYLDRIDRCSSETWEKYVSRGGIKKVMSPEEFYQQMQDNNKREKIITKLREVRTSNASFEALAQSDGTNYFLINDIGYGVACEKCNTSRTVVLLMDSELTQNLEEKVYLPSFESYFNLGIEPTGTEFRNLFPIPVNSETDWWYCPYCNEMHKFLYDMDLGLLYNQEVINISSAERLNNEVLYKNDNLKKYLIGFDNDDKITNVKATLKQIESIKDFELCISDENGNLLSWDDIDDIRNRNTLLQTILWDRKIRVNSNISMADRPPFCVFTVDKNRIIRLEYYQGHDALELIYDIRAFELYGKKIPAYQENDGLAYDLGNDPFVMFGKLLLGTKNSEKFERIVKEAHDKHLNVKCNKYQARLSITLEEHRKLFQEEMLKTMTLL